MAHEPSESPIDNADMEETIRNRAYALWQSEGSPEGREEEYWHRAKELIEAETQSSYPPAASRGHRS